MLRNGLFDKLIGSKKDKKEKQHVLVNEDERSQVYLIPKEEPVPPTPVPSESTITPENIFAAAKNVCLDFDFMRKNVNQSNKDMRDTNNRTLLHEAALHNHLLFAEHLISLGVDVNAHDINWLTPLHDAACSGSLEVIELLLNAGALLNKLDAWSQTAQARAEIYGQRAAISLLKKGIITTPPAEVKKSDPTEAEIRVQLFKSAKDGDLSFIKAHVNKNNLEIREDKTGKTLLHCAAELGHVEIISYLLELGADVNAKDTEWVTTPLHYAAMKGRTATIQLLLKAGARINEINKSGETPIGLSAGWRHVAATELLMSNNADVNIRNNMGKLPLHYAITPRNHEGENKEAQLQIVDILLRKTNLDAMYYDQTEELNFLKYAAKHKQWHVVTRLEKLQQPMQAHKENDNALRVSLRRSC